MAKTFHITAGAKPDQYTDIVSIGDVVSYRFDATPWAEDNNDISSVVWTVESGQVSITGQQLASGVASANVTFSQQGSNLISLQINTIAQKKKVWLQVYAKDVDRYVDDYQING